MIIFSKNECIEWAKQYRIKLDDCFSPLCCNNARYRLRSLFPAAFGKIMWAARQIDAALYVDSQCLVWVTDSGIFTSSENLQLFYRYRQSYGNNKLLADAPGHLCLSYERAEIVSLLWLCMLQGWDAHIFPDIGSSSAFISHDGWFELGYSELAASDSNQKQFSEAGIEMKKIEIRTPQANQ